MIFVLLDPDLRLAGIVYRINHHMLTPQLCFIKHYILDSQTAFKKLYGWASWLMLMKPITKY